MMWFLTKTTEATQFLIIFLRFTPMNMNSIPVAVSPQCLNTPWHPSQTPAPCLMMVGLFLRCSAQCLDRHQTQMLWRYQGTGDSETEDTKNKEYKFYLLLVLLLIIFVLVVWLLTANIHIDLWGSPWWSPLSLFLFVFLFFLYFSTRCQPGSPLDYK